MAGEIVIPARVLQFAAKVSGNPISWRETPEFIVIVFADGRKLTFDLVETVEETPPEAAQETADATASATAPAGERPAGRKPRR